MAAPTIECIADARVEFLRRAPRPELFCPDCTAYIGAFGEHTCTGDPVAHVRNISPKAVKEGVG